MKSSELRYRGLSFPGVDLSVMIFTRYFGVSLLRERQMMSRPAGVFQLLPTFASYAAKNVSSC